MAFNIDIAQSIERQFAAIIVAICRAGVALDPELRAIGGVLYCPDMVKVIVAHRRTGDINISARVHSQAVRIILSITWAGVTRYPALSSGRIILNSREIVYVIIPRRPAGYISRTGCMYGQPRNDIIS